MDLGPDWVDMSAFDVNAFVVICSKRRISCTNLVPNKQTGNYVAMKWSPLITSKLRYSKFFCRAETSGPLEHEEIFIHQ